VFQPPIQNVNKPFSSVWLTVNSYRILWGQQAPLHRSILMLNQLSQWVGAEEVTKIPDELVARLAGVLTKTLQVARTTSVKATPQGATLSTSERLLGR
jgi:hypothetical protein